MTNQANGQEIAELSAAFTTALTLICNRLIERGALDREEIKADLAAEVETLRKQEPSVLREMVLSGLAFALHAGPPTESSGRRTPPPHWQMHPSRDEDITTIDALDVNLKLIGRDESF